MEAWYYRRATASYQDSIKLLEADVQQANTLASAIPTAKDGARLHMKLVDDHMAPLFLYFFRWLDSSCTCLLPRYLNLFHIIVYKVYADGRPNASMYGRKATIREFYTVILPSLQRLSVDFELDCTKGGNCGPTTFSRKRAEAICKSPSFDSERENECGICLEPCSKVVLPDCFHEMCINCYRDWNTRSGSCPFCRGNLKRVNSEDLWVLTCTNEVIDVETATMNNLVHFYTYMNSLPKDSPDILFFLYYEYLI